MKSTRQGLLVAGDIICFVAGFFAFSMIGYGNYSFHEIVRLHDTPFALLVIIWMITMYVFNFYDMRASKPNMIFLRNFSIAAIIMLGIGFIFFYINPTTRISPKSNLIIFETISLLLILGWRRIFYLITRDSFRTKFAIVCSEEKYHSLVSEIAEHPHLGLENQGTFTTLTEFFHKQPAIDLLIIHKTDAYETKLLEQVLASHVEVIDLAEAYETILYKIPVAFIDNEWIIRSITKGTDFFYRLISRIISILFAGIVLILTSPISLAVIIAIKLEDGGPVIYKNDRVGLHGKKFHLYKFRSMTPDQKSMAVWTQTNDPRITRVGKITRKLHVDEIPQLLNILKGDISLVGPRPEQPQYVAQLEKDIPYYFMRHTISPGFTGWAQIKFRYARSVMDSQEKFEYDLFYLKNRNFFLDIGIILKTVQIIFTH